MAKDPYKYFRVEARELIGELGDGALALERSGADVELVGRLLRIAHTLKGASRVVKRPELAELAHSVEDVLSPHRATGGPLEQDSVGRLLELVDALRAGLATLDTESSTSPEQAPPAEARKTSRTDASYETVRVDIAEMDELLDGVFQLGVDVFELGRDVDVLEHLSELAGDVAAEADGLGDAVTAGRRLGRLRATAAQLADRARRAAHRFDARTGDLTKAVEALRHRASAMRLVPAAVMEGDLVRAVRDAADASGKQVELRWDGGELRIDAQVLSVLRGALVHLVRNAVAHGVEPPSVRTAQGKSEVGAVSVELRRRGHRVAVRCADDGRGIDSEAVQRAAADRGLRPSGSSAPNMDESMALILGGGISTTAEPTHVSGRGLGLEAVREAAAMLDGEVRMESAAGRGTLVELIVPLSLSSLPALEVEVDGVRALVPLDSVSGVVDLRRQDVVQGEDGARVLVEGAEAPLLWLDGLLRRKHVHGHGNRSRMAVVVRTADGLAALVVDRVFGARNVVVRPLPEGTMADPVVAGASLGPSGAPEIVLSTHALGATRSLRRREIGADSPSRLPILVIDDSLTTRMLEQSILESAGYEVDLAVSGEEALEKVQDRRYGLFLVDVEMPGMNGFEFIERARSDASLRDVPSILVTSLSSEEDRRRGREVGARDYIVKSEFDQQALLRTIRSLIG